MSSKSPVFPIPQHPHHFSDYGFDPQMDYLQILEEARKHKRDSSRSIEALHFKLQKPISKEDTRKNKSKSRKKKWWKNALLFWKWKWDQSNGAEDEDGRGEYVKRAPRIALSGPVYIVESRSGAATPCRATSGPLTPMRKGGGDVPYVNLRDMNMEDEAQHRISASAMPIYLVT